MFFCLQSDFLLHLNPLPQSKTHADNDKISCSISAETIQPPPPKVSCIFFSPPRSHIPLSQCHPQPLTRHKIYSALLLALRYLHVSLFGLIFNIWSAYCNVVPKAKAS